MNSRTPASKVAFFSSFALSSASCCALIAAVEGEAWMCLENGHAATLAVGIIASDERVHAPGELKGGREVTFLSRIHSATLCANSQPR